MKRNILAILKSPKHAKKRTWEEGLQKLVEPFDAPPPPGIAEQTSLMKMLKCAYGDNLPQSSHRPIETHFQGLFEGLETLKHTPPPLLNMPEPQKLAHIHNISSNSELLNVFNTLYYHGMLTRAVASAIISSKKLASAEDIDHIYRLVFSGGSLIHWSPSDKYVVLLQVANRLWRADRGKAGEILLQTDWKPALQNKLLESRAVAGIGRAWLSLGASGEAKIREFFMKPDKSLTRSLYIPLWTACIQMGHHDLGRQLAGVAEDNLFIQFVKAAYARYDTIKFHPDIVKLPYYENAEQVIYLLDYVKDHFDRDFAIEIVRLVEPLVNSKFGSPDDSEISWALAMQKLKVLQKRADMESPSSIRLDDHDVVRA
ncbi:hypothetical protein TRVA0_012S02652 [Trichomonascus vanleenenianus]|uniref:uncharacterized protein n=1 Tax=Trichomonascus vanleenenianus TaxID=2268995 RepID=UPI003ECA1F31